MTFLCVKAFEWYTEIAHGYTITASTFWSFYYTAAGLHACHVIAGAMGIMMIVAKRRSQATELHRVELIGIYWHFVDVVWIFLFPLPVHRQVGRESDPMAGHHRNYTKIWAILVVLLVVSVLGPMLEIQIVTLITAFGIAFVKAFLVCKHFMHLDVEKPIVWYILTTCLAFMVLFFSAVAPDVMKHEGSNWSNEAAKEVVTTLMAEGAAGADHGDHGDGHGDDHAEGGGHH